MIKRSTARADDNQPVDEIDTWIFDLDNTLYPAHCNLFDQIDLRMGGFIQSLLSVDPVEARRIQKRYFADYGTTLRGLMDHHGVHPDDFLAHVHDVDLSPIEPNQALETAIKDLPGRKLVFTNASQPYADKVLERLGIAHLMDEVFDIADADYVPKPQLTPYQTFIKYYEVDTHRSLMIEDMARNLKPAHQLGMTTVWLRTDYSWGTLHHEADHVHHEIDDLSHWLRQVADGQIDPHKGAPITSTTSGRD